MTRIKDSGNPWVREIPSDWFEKKLRYLVKLRGEKSVTTDYKKYVGLENIMSQTGQYVQTGIEVDLTENLTFEVGDILFGKLRPYLRKYWRAEFSGTASSEFVIIKGSSLNLNFLFWAIQSDSFINDVDSSTYGSKMPRASWEYMKNIKLPFPESIEEQTKIADFLDKKVTQLDKVKSLLEEQIKTLEDYRQSLIYETVTKGLDKTAPLKDSGVDWIGQIPEGWEIRKIGSMYSERSEKVSDKDYPPLSVTKKGILPQVEGVAKTDNGDNRKLVKKGDFVINSRSDRKGSSGIAKQDGSVSLINIVLENSLRVSDLYYNFLFRSVLFAEEFYKWGNGIVADLWSTHWTAMKKIGIPVPPLKDQEEISYFLEKRTTQLDELIDIKQKQIDNINKQRQTLIYDYVTGKRRI
ncbi:TPA: restriction endonuclease subunit S [Streptococcus suis]